MIYSKYIFLLSRESYLFLTILSIFILLQDGITHLRSPRPVQCSHLRALTLAMVSIMHLLLHLRVISLYVTLMMMTNIITNPRMLMKMMTDRAENGIVAIEEDQWEDRMQYK